MQLRNTAAYTLFMMEIYSDFILRQYLLKTLSFKYNTSLSAKLILLKCE